MKECNINATRTTFATCVYIFTIVVNLHRTKLADLSLYFSLILIQHLPYLLIQNLNNLPSIVNERVQRPLHNRSEWFTQCLRLRLLCNCKRSSRPNYRHIARINFINARNLLRDGDKNSSYNRELLARYINLTLLYLYISSRSLNLLFLWVYP